MGERRAASSNRGKQRERESRECRVAICSVCFPLGYIFLCPLEYSLSITTLWKYTFSWYFMYFIFNLLSSSFNLRFSISIFLLKKCVMFCLIFHKIFVLAYQAAPKDISIYKPQQFDSICILKMSCHPHKKTLKYHPFARSKLRSTTAVAHLVEVVSDRL